MAKILVVEDHELPWEGLSYLLQSYGVRNEDISRARWYLEAKEMIRSGHYDVVFLDHRMPMHDPGCTDTENHLTMLLEDIGYLLIPLIRETSLGTIVVGTSSMSEERLSVYPKPDFNMQKYEDIPPEVLEMLKE